MLFDQSYKAAMKAPTGKGGRGWKYAGEASTQATLAFSLAVKWCITSEAIYNWANQHGIRLFDERKRLHETDDLLLVAVLNDWSLSRTEKELEKARHAKGKP